MNKQHAELFATLHQFATTVSTVFEVLADTRQGERQDIPTAPPAGDGPGGCAAEPTEPPTPRTDDLCLACGRAREAMARVRHGRICMDCISESVDDLRIQEKRACLAETVAGIQAQLAELGRLAGAAIDDDGERSLPILGREVLRLLGLFRKRQGPFGIATGPTGVVRDDAEQGRSSGLGAETA